MLSTVSSQMFRTTLLVGLMGLASCGITDAKGKFKNSGEPPVWQDLSELPAPDGGSVEPNTLKINLQCPLMEEDEEMKSSLLQAVVAQCRNAGLGDIKLLPKGSKKQAHYEIMVYESGENGEFNFNEEAGVLGGLGTGVATGLLTQDAGYGVLGGLGGGALSSWAFGEKKEIYMFAGVCRQRTSAQATKELGTSSEKSGGSQSGGRDADTGTVTTSEQAREMMQKAKWNLKTQSFEFPFAFSIVVKGGSFSSKDARDAAAREVFVKRLPAFVTGGTSIGG